MPVDVLTLALSLTAALVVVVGVGVMIYMFSMHVSLSFKTRSSVDASNASESLPDTILPDNALLQNPLQDISSLAETSAVSFSVAYINAKTQQYASRECWVTVPQGFTTSSDVSSFAVFFFFHGTSMSAEAAMLSCQELVGCGCNCVCFALQGSTLTDELGTVYSWDVNNLTGQDDLSLVKQLFESVSADSRLDLTRVYACGHSVGSLFISNVLATQTTYFTGGCLCLSSQLLVDTDITNAASSASPANIVFINGDQDTLIPVAGGTASFNEDLNFRSVTDSVSAWSLQNACTTDLLATQGTFSYFPTLDSSASTPATYQLYMSPCSAGLVAGYVLSAAAPNAIQHNTIQPALNLFNVSNTASLTLAVFQDITP
jgi:hypothetical protein